MTYLSPAAARKELVKMAHGKVPRVPVPILIEYTLNYLMQDSVPTAAHVSEVRWLERLYALEDPRCER